MNDLYVAFKVGTGLYVLPATTVLHMETFTAATPVPGTPPHVIGVVQIRQRVVPVIDLRLRFGIPPADVSLNSRVMVVEHAKRVVGMLVDSAREVVRVPKKDFSPPPEIIKEQSAGFVRAVAHKGSDLVMLLDCAKVIGDVHEKEISDEQDAHSGRGGPGGHPIAGTGSDPCVAPVGNASQSG